MSEWISVEDDLPVEGQRVIAFRHAKNVDMRMTLITWWEGDEDDQRITHWQPLPEPPK